MALVIYVVLTGLIQLCAGQVASNRQGIGNTAFSSLHNAQSNPNLLNPNTLLTNQLRSQNLGVTNFANNAANGNGFASVATGKLGNVNTNVASNLGVTNSLLNTNTATQNLANNLASANAAVNNLDGTNLNKPNLANVANSNIQYPGLVNQAANPSLPGNFANSIASKYQVPSHTQSYGIPYGNNFASNLANGNMGNFNRQPGWNSNLAPGYSNPGPKALPNGQQYGIYVQADGLEIGGNVEVTGNMPIYGTVSLNGKLPTGGAGSVNYACSR